MLDSIKTKKMFFAAVGIVILGALIGFLNGQLGGTPVVASTLIGGGVGFSIDILSYGIVLLYFEALEEIFSSFGRLDEVEKPDLSKTSFFVSQGCLGLGSLIGFLVGFFSKSVNIAIAVLIGAGVGTFFSLLVAAIFIGFGILVEIR